MMMEEEFDVREINTQFEAVKLGMRHTKDGHILALAINPDDTPDDIMRDRLGQRYMVVLVRINDHEMPVASPDQEEGIRAVKLAGALCSDPEFQMWMVTSDFANDATEDEAAQGVRTFCGVKSRAELRMNKTARMKLAKLRDMFTTSYRR